MDLIAEIRRRCLVRRESISCIARDLNLSRPTVRKHCRSQCEPLYRRQKQPTPMLGAFEDMLETWLRAERHLPKAQRRTARRLFEGLQAEGYRGAYDSVQLFVRRWKAVKSGPALTQAFVPLSFSPGESASSTGAMSTSSSAGSCRPSRSRISAWRSAARCSSRPTRGRPRRTVYVAGL